MLESLKEVVEEHDDDEEDNSQTKSKSEESLAANQKQGRYEHITNYEFESQIESRIKISNRASPV